MWVKRALGAWRRASSFPKLAIKHAAFFAVGELHVGHSERDARQLSEDAM